MNDMMLIVDDIEMNRDILKVIFDHQYEIMEAEDGVEALEILERCQGSIDIVLLDLMMPGMGGFELLEIMKKNDILCNIPVVVITGSGAMEDQIKAFQLGANDFIVKPFIPEIVISRVNNVMASNRRMQSIEIEVRKFKAKSELDEMTGLYNKSTTENIIEDVLVHSERHLETMLIIDIDNFKTVNDTSGHQAGDHVIKIIADLISSKFRKMDIVGRIGGDEFCVLVVDAASKDVVYNKVNELIQTMRYKPNLTIPEYVTLSIGMADNDKQNTTYEELFKKADAALYQAKKNGKAQYCEYGVEHVSVEEDDRPAVVLLGNNRSVCSVIHSLIPVQIRMIEALQFEDLAKISAEDKSRIRFMYVDVSDRGADASEYWTQIAALDWIDMGHVYAICQEGNVEQYMNALQSGVHDMITTPIDADAFKRRIAKQFEALDILQK